MKIFRSINYCICFFYFVDASIWTLCFQFERGNLFSYGFVNIMLTFLYREPRSRPRSIGRRSLASHQRSNVCSVSSASLNRSLIYDAWGSLKTLFVQLEKIKVWQIKARFNLALSCGFMILFNHINHTSNWKLLFICLAKYIEFLTLFLVVWLLAAFSVSFLKMIGLNCKYLKNLAITRKISQEVSSRFPIFKRKILFIFF